MGWVAFPFRRSGWRRGAPLYFYLCHTREGERGTDTDANSSFTTSPACFVDDLLALCVLPERLV